MYFLYFAMGRKQSAQAVVQVKILGGEKVIN